STPFSQAMVAIGLLVGFQFIITWLSVRTQAIQKLVKAEPTLLLFKGRMLEAVLKDSRVAKGEILAAIRMSGAASTEEVDAVVLETNGNFSVIKELDIKKASAFKDVRGFKENAMREM
ncbi:MAG: YetF domain-containing protein, partial [Cyanobacteria bacterium J06621_11]